MAIIVGVTKNHLAVFADAMSHTFLGINAFREFRPRFRFLFLLKGKFEFGAFVLFIRAFLKGNHRQLKPANS